MVLTEPERELLERALDALALADHQSERHDALLLYRRAVAVVRDRPEGHRRVRSDNGTRRTGPQLEPGA